jgi:hypothetical protein
MHPYERWIIRRYLANALRSSQFARPQRADLDIVAWIDSHWRLLGLPQLVPRRLSSKQQATIEAMIKSRTWRSWRAAANSIAREPEPNPSSLQKRVDWLAGACSLSGSQSRVLGLLARPTRTPEVRCLVEAINDRFDSDGRDFHSFLEASSERVELSARDRLSERYSGLLFFVQCEDAALLFAPRSLISCMTVATPATMTRVRLEGLLRESRPNPHRPGATAEIS